MKRLLVTFVFAAFATPAVAELTWHNVYTDTAKDCIVVSLSNENSEIDFGNNECKGFGGYQLNIGGGDARSQVSLTFGRDGLDVGQPEGAFYSVPLKAKIEWLYTLETDLDGSALIEWRALVYRLQETHADGISPGFENLYVVRLNKEETCFLGRVKTNEQAHALAKNSNASCQ